MGEVYRAEDTTLKRQVNGLAQRIFYLDPGISNVPEPSLLVFLASGGWQHAVLLLSSFCFGYSMGERLFHGVRCSRATGAPDEFVK